MMDTVTSGILKTGTDSASGRLFTIKIQTPIVNSISTFQMNSDFAQRGICGYLIVVEFLNAECRCQTGLARQMEVRIQVN
jgi:hypothetical protein